VRHCVPSHFNWSLTLGLDSGSQLQASGLEHLHPLDRRLGEPSYSARGTEKESTLRLLYAFFWVIPRRLNFICRHFGTLCSIFIGRYEEYLPMKMEEAECSETSSYKIQTPSNYPEEETQHSEHG